MSHVMERGPGVAGWNRHELDIIGAYAFSAGYHQWRKAGPQGSGQVRHIAVHFLRESKLLAPHGKDSLIVGIVVKQFVAGWQQHQEDSQQRG